MSNRIFENLKNLPFWSTLVPHFLCWYIVFVCLFLSSRSRNFQIFKYNVKIRELYSNMQIIWHTDFLWTLSSIVWVSLTNVMKPRVSDLDKTIVSDKKAKVKNTTINCYSFWKRNPVLLHEKMHLKLARSRFETPINSPHPGLYIISC